MSNGARGYERKKHKKKMLYESMERSHLTESGVSTILGNALKQCHQVKERYYNMMYNLLGAILFVCVVASVLIYKYRGKPTVAERRERENTKKAYILERIKNYKISKLRAEQQLLTGLPHFDPPERN